MALIELPIPAGVYKNGTKRDAKGRYFDANLVRWTNGKLKPIGGWARTTSTALDGTGRTMLSFKDNSNNKYIAVGTSEKLYIYQGSTSTPSDITPNVFTSGNQTSQVGTGFGSGPFNGPGVYKTFTSSNITASTTDDSFNISSNDFPTTDFAVGDLIQVSGFSNSGNNNKTYPFELP